MSAKTKERTLGGYTEEQIADLESRFSEVLMHATNGRMSRTNYTFDAMRAEIDDAVMENVDEALNEERKYGSIASEARAKALDEAAGAVDEIIKGYLDAADLARARASVVDKGLWEAKADNAKLIKKAILALKDKQS